MEMKKRRISIAVGLITFLLVVSSASSELLDRGGGLIYDTDLNITWLQNASLGGKRTWQDAVNWADNLVYYDSVRDVYYEDWRLPDTNQCFYIAPGSSEFNCTSSELLYMHYFNLQNSYSTYTGEIALKNTGIFGDSLKAFPYWTSKPFSEPNSYDLSAIYFDFSGGDQGWANIAYSFYAWAVRDGDVAVTVVPEPISATLFVIGAVPAVGLHLRKTKKRQGRNIN